MFIFERFFRDFGLLVGAAFLYLIMRDSQILWQNSALLVVVLFAPISRLVQYLCTYYSIDENSLYVESGWLRKKKQEVPLSNITTVDFTQGFIFQIAKVYSVHVDNASSISGENSGKINMVLKVDDAIKVKGLLLAKHRQPDQELHDNRISEDTSGNTIVASVGELFLMGLLRSKVFIVVQLFAYGGVAVSIFSKLFLEKRVDGEAVILEYALSLSGPILIGSMILALYLIGVLVSVALSTVKYYGFRVTNRESSIFIEYGLLTRKTHTLMKEKISGISYNQSLFMRAFKRGTLEVFAVGYGGAGQDNQQETAVLYPVMRQEKLYDFLERFLPEVKARQTRMGTEVKALPYFFLCGRFFFALFLCLAAMLPWPVYPVIRWCIVAAGIAILLLAAGSVLFEYGNTSISGNGTVISLSCGGYTKKTVLLKTEKVESIEERATERKRCKKQLTNIGLGILAPSGNSRQKVRNMRVEAFEKLKSNLIY